MSSVVDTKVAVRTFKTCVKEKGSDNCLAERSAVTKGMSNVVKAECSAYVEDFFGCFVHRYRLNSCTDATVANLLKCQESLTSNMLNAQ